MFSNEIFLNVSLLLEVLSNVIFLFTLIVVINTLTRYLHKFKEHYLIHSQTVIFNWLKYTELNDVP